MLRHVLCAVFLTISSITAINAADCCPTVQSEQTCCACPEQWAEKYVSSLPDQTREILKQLFEIELRVYEKCRAELETMHRELRACCDEERVAEKLCELQSNINLNREDQEKHDALVKLLDAQGFDAYCEFIKMMPLRLEYEVTDDNHMNEEQLNNLFDSLQTAFSRLSCIICECSRLC